MEEGKSILDTSFRIVGFFPMGSKRISERGMQGDSKVLVICIYFKVSGGYLSICFIINF